MRARIERVVEWLDAARPDVALLQETKVTEENFPTEPIGDLGYNIEAVGEAGGRNGVAILSRRPIDDVVKSLPGDPHDQEARYIEAFTGGIRVASVYVPNGTALGSDRFTFKLAYFARLREHAATVLEDMDTPFVLGGDFNVAPQPIDVFDAQALDGTICYHPGERAGFRGLAHLGLYDAFRTAHPKAQEYSWWHYQGRSWRANEGLRIDHLMLSPLAIDRLQAAGMDRGERAKKTPSDHIPVWCELA